jgi:hypothetical protein
MRKKDTMFPANPMSTIRPEGAILHPIILLLQIPFLSLESLLEFKNEKK